MPHNYEVVISGIGGKFPPDCMIEDFAEALFENRHVYNEAPWTKNENDVCHKVGCLENARNNSSFDSAFFGIHKKAADMMDPQHKHSMEVGYEAIADSGMNYHEIRGRKYDTYACMWTAEKDLFIYDKNLSGFATTGTARCMCSNRLCYSFHLVGASATLDTTHVSFAEAIRLAAKRIREGQIEGALITSSNLINYSAISFHVKQLGKLSEDGTTRPFDADANGYRRSDGFCSLLLQRGDIAKKKYATVIFADEMFDGYNKKDFTEVNQENFESFLDECYKKAKINPNDIKYLEAHGCGVKKLDEIELNALGNYFSKHRKDPLKIGSVKGNYGHAEVSAGMFSLIKILLAMEKGIIPATIHYKNPNPNVKYLKNGMLEVVSKNEEWDCSYAAINCFGIGSSFGHVILKGNPKPKLNINCDLPLLTIMSTRTESGIQEIVDAVKNSPKDLEFSNLTHEGFKQNIPMHLYRGYVLHSKEVQSEIESFSGNKRPLWFVYSGMGSQWQTMCRELLHLPIFRESMEKSHAILKPKGLDLMHIVTTDDPTIFDTILHSFCAIAATQIALTDILKKIGLVPDGMIGHSVGELGCAYADNCLTDEQMILSAYSRGKASIDSNVIKGYMAAVGLGAKKMKTMVPPTIDVACHNGPDSCTLSGPAEDMEKYVEELKAQGIFVKLVNVANKAYHSRYVKPIAPPLKKMLDEIIPERKMRSNKWISTSIKDSDWQTEAAKYNSADYFINNLLNSVLFEEGCKYIPKDAICVEIAPHGLLQAILKRSLPNTVTNITLTKRGSNMLDTLFSALGKIYNTGIEMDLSILYPKIEYPISRGTNRIGQLVRWDHAEEEDTFFAKINYDKCEKIVEIFLIDQKYKHINEYKISGKTYLPPIACLDFIVELFSQKNKTENIVFENIYLKKFLEVKEGTLIRLCAGLGVSTGYFEITKSYDDSDDIIISGTIKTLDNYESSIAKLPHMESKGIQYEDTESKEFYKILNHRGYDFGESYRNIKSLTTLDGGVKAKTLFNKDWKTLVESMIQLVMYRNGQKDQQLLLPNFIRSISLSQPKLPKKNEEVDIIHNYNLDIVEANGIQIAGIMTEEMQIKKENITFDEFKFIRYHKEQIKDKDQAITIALETIFQNSNNSSEFQVLQFEDNVRKPEISKKHFANYPKMKTKFSFITANKKIAEKPSLIVGNDKYFNDALALFKSMGEYLLLILPETEKFQINKDDLILLKIKIDGNNLYLLKKLHAASPKILNLTETEYTFADISKKVQEWIVKTKTTKDQKVFVTLNTLPKDGLKSFLTSLKSKSDLGNVRFLFMLDKNVPECVQTEVFYQTAFKQDVRYSVFQNGTWGTYVNIPKDAVQENGQISNTIIAANKLSRVSSKTTVEYLGLNLVDAANQQEKDIKHFDYVGTDSSGIPIMGVAQTESNGMKIVPDPVLQWTYPDIWTQMDATTVPYAYSMAYYALFEIGNIQRGENVLINAGCTPFAQACLLVATCYGCPTYITVDTEQQRALVKELQPTLPNENILDGKTTAFELHVKVLTKGVGAHVVINAQSGRKLQAAKDCLANYGRFIQLCRSTADKYATTGMNCFLRCCSVIGVDSENLLEKPSQVKHRIQQLVQQGIDTGVVKPLDKVIYNEETHGKVSSFLQSPKCFNSLIFNIENITKQACDLPIGDQNGVTLVYGTISDELVDLVNWIISQGTKKIVIASKSQFNNFYVNHRLSLIDYYYNVESYMIMKSAEKLEVAKEILKEASQFGPIQNIYITTGNNFEFNSAKNFDEALSSESRNVPLICFLGNSAEKAVSRENKKPVFNIRWQENCKFDHVLNALDKILIDGCEDVTVKGDTKVAKKDSLQADIFETLPKTIPLLDEIGEEARKQTGLSRIQSHCPKYMDWLLPLFVFPGVYGNSSFIKKLAIRFMYPTFCVNVNHSEKLEDSIQKITKDMLQKCPKGPFNIVSFSWGGPVAMEVAKYLERSGHKVVWFNVDGAPNSLKDLLNDQKFVKEDFLAKLLGTTNKGNMAAKDILTQNIKSYFDSNPEIDENCGSINLENVMVALDLIEKYIDFANKYDIKDVINGKTNLFRPVNSDLYDGCGLTKVCTDVRIKVSKESHQNILKDEEILTQIHDNFTL